MTIASSTDAKAATVLKSAARAMQKMAKAAAAKAEAALPTEERIAGLECGTGDKTSVMIVQLSTMDVIEDLAEALFEADERIEYVKQYQTYMVLYRPVHKKIAAWKKVIMDTAADDCEVKSITAVKVPAWKKLDTGIIADSFELLHRREIDVSAMPAAREQHIRVFRDGAWRFHGMKQFLGQKISTMKQHSTTRNHPFNQDMIYALLKQDLDDHSSYMKVRAAEEGRVLRDTDLLQCHCPRNNYRCDAVIGECGSFDRLCNNLGYSDPDQKRFLTHKEHNTPLKEDTAPQPRAKTESYFTITAQSMTRHVDLRMAKIALMKKRTSRQQEQLNFWSIVPRPLNLTFEGHRAQLEALQKVQKICARKGCNRELYFGDAQKLLTQKDMPQQASPDRIDNFNDFYDGNTQFKCQPCNDVVKHSARRDTLSELSGDQVFFNVGEVQQMKQCIDELKADYIIAKKTKK